MGNRASCLDPEAGRLWTERCENGSRLLLRPLVLKIGDGGSITVPAGFVTDFSSIPPAAGWVMAWSKVDIAGIVHDWLYAEGSMDRSEADRIWREVALCGGHSANGLQAWLGRGALFLVGWLAWNRHRRRTAPLSPGDPVTSPNNDNELQKCTDSLVPQRQENQFTTEAIAKRMRALPEPVDRFEREKEDRDFRLVFLLRCASVIGASLRLTDAAAPAPGRRQQCPGRQRYRLKAGQSDGPRRGEHFREHSPPWRNGIGRLRETVLRCSTGGGAPFVPDFWKQ